MPKADGFFLLSLSFSFVQKGLRSFDTLDTTDLAYLVSRLSEGHLPRFLKNVSFVSEIQVGRGPEVLRVRKTFSDYMYTFSKDHKICPLEVKSTFETFADEIRQVVALGHNSSVRKLKNFSNFSAIIPVVIHNLANGRICKRFCITPNR